MAVKISRFIKSTSSFAKRTTALSTPSCPEHAPVETPGVTVLTVGQHAVTQGGELCGKVYPAVEVGRRVRELYFNVILLLLLLFGSLLVIVHLDVRRRRSARAV